MGLIALFDTIHESDCTISTNQVVPNQTSIDNFID